MVIIGILMERACSCHFGNWTLNDLVKTTKTFVKPDVTKISTDNIVPSTGSLSFIRQEVTEIRFYRNEVFYQNIGINKFCFTITGS